MRAFTGVGLTLLLTSSAAVAHHSFAMFDQSKSVTLTGTVKEFQFTSPHAWIQLLVPGDQGEPEEWGVEMGAAGGLLRGGWTKKTLQPGDKISVVVNPLRDGSHGGSFKSATREDGSRVGPAPRGGGP